MKVYFLKESEYEDFIQEHKDHIFRVVNFSHSLDNSDAFLARASIVPIDERSYEV